MIIHIVDDSPKPSMVFVVPAGVHITLADRTIGVRSTGDEVAVPVPSIKTTETYQLRDRTEDREVRLQPDEPMIGASRGPRRYPKFFSFTVYSGVERSDVLTIRWPRLVVNGEAVALPEITFEKKRWHRVLMPVNC